VGLGQKGPLVWKEEMEGQLGHCVVVGGGEEEGMAEKIARDSGKGGSCRIVCGG
jgi:hypothetical protein